MVRHDTFITQGDDRELAVGATRHWRETVDSRYWWETDAS